MKIFLDTPNLYDVERYKHFVDGVATVSPLTTERESSEQKNAIRKFCSMVSSHVILEVTSEQYENILKESNQLTAIHEKVCIKLPCTYDGFLICKRLSSSGIATNLASCFSPAQAILAAKCGATYLSVEIEKLNDNGCDSLAFLKEIAEIYKANNFETEILSTSIRNTQQVAQSAMIGVAVVQLPPKILQECFEHPLIISEASAITKNAREKTS